MPLCVRCQTIRIPPKPVSQRGAQRIVCDDCSTWRGPKPRVTDACLQCGTDLLSLGIRRADARFCSSDCRTAAHRATGYRNPPKPPKPPKPPVERTCRWCDVTFMQSGGRGRPAYYCSPLCRSRAFQQRRIADGRWELQNDQRRKHEPRPCQDCGKTLRIGIRCRKCSRDLRANIGGSYQQKAARQRVFERDGWTCQLCGGHIDSSLAGPDPMAASIDHIVPLRDCLDVFGPDFVDDETNWQAAHLTCNSSKGARLASA